MGEATPRFIPQSEMERAISAASNPETSPAYLEELWSLYCTMTDDMLKLRHAIARNPNIPLSLVMDILGWAGILPSLLENPALPLWILEGFPGLPAMWVDILVRELEKTQSLYAVSARRTLEVKFPDYCKSVKVRDFVPTAQGILGLTGEGDSLTDEGDK